MSKSRDPRTEEAIEIVGVDRREHGFALNPHKHASQLREKGGAELATILESDMVRSIMDRYEGLDRTAVERQMSFKKLCGLTLSAIALLTYLSLFALALPLSEDLLRTVRFWALIAIYVGMSVGFSGMAWLHYSKPDVAWRKARAGAEVERGRIFDAVMEADRERTSLLPQKLEYVRRYQLDLQEDYYSHRGAQHEARVRQGFRWKLIFFLFALLAVAAMFATHFVEKGENGVAPIDERFSALLLDAEVAYADLVLLQMALLLAIWWVVSHTLAQIGGAARNATLFAIARDKLVDLRKTELEQARRAAARGDDSEVQAFVDKLRSVLTSEHQGWLALERAAPEAAQSKIEGSIGSRTRSSL